MVVFISAERTLISLQLLDYLRMKHKNLIDMSWAEKQDWFGLEDFIMDHHPELCFGCRAATVIYKNDVPYIDDNPYWEMADHELIAIKDMDTTHIKNCIKRIYKSNGVWRHQYLRLFEAELRKRRILSRPEQF